MDRVNTRQFVAKVPDYFQTGLGLPPIPYTTGYTEPGSTGMGARP
jgi:hypothetical protein